MRNNRCWKIPRTAIASFIAGDELSTLERERFAESVQKKWETKILARILGSFVELLLFVGALKRLPTTPRETQLRWQLRFCLFPAADILNGIEGLFDDRGKKQFLMLRLDRKTEAVGRLATRGGQIKKK